VANCAVTRRSLWLFFCVISLVPDSVRQASYAAQIRGVVIDQTGAVAVITNNATNISQVSHCDHHDQYFFAGLRPTVHAGGHAAQLSVGS
jgi:hypothetical protein